ncbi:MAG: bifunctional folylpolyglutamate synthase/dihydrofolate synthase [Acidimicrobiales bacterium]
MRTLAAAWSTAPSSSNTSHLRSPPAAHRRSRSARAAQPPERRSQLNEPGPFSPPAEGPAGASIGEALAWLDRHINLEAIESGKAGRHAEPTLERIAALVAAMGDPQSAFPKVHVTGTNGKGSTTRMISSLLEADGLRAGSYTSPHLVSINERMSIAGEAIPDDELALQLAAMAELEAFIGVKATWFELVTATAFRWFADEAVDAAVVEVGLGGRWDATNIGNGEVAVVTNVQLDHTEILGDTRELIAAEKAGIVKPGTVLVLCEEDEAVAAVFEAEAERVGATAVWRRGPDFSASNLRLAVGGRVANLETPAGTYEDVFVPLAGAHQCENAAIALAGAQALLGAPLSQDVVSAGFAAVRAPGRLEIVGRRPFVVLDGAHNPAGAVAVGAALAEDFAFAKRVIVVMGCLRGRSAGSLLSGLWSSRIEHVVACAPPTPRAQPPRAVLEAARDLGLSATECDDVREAVEAALAMAGEDDLVLVTGSLYVVGAARPVLGI